MTPADTDGPVLPYRTWWGLAGCAIFMGVIIVFAPYGEGVPFAPDRGNFWYYWQRADATAWTRLSAWLPYCAHQIAIWYLIARARRQRPRYVGGLHDFNLLALLVNGVFALLHVVQTRIFYDGLAQDVHEATSMGSVVLMLLLILVLENRRRGMFLGYPAPGMATAGDVVRRYHGYYFSWAIIYTFWYHPIETTAGHLVGFAYMSLLLLQSSLFFTRHHVNRWWTMALETIFVLHAAVVAGSIMARGGPGPWAMFLFGGAGVFLVTQLHGLGLSVRSRCWIALPILAAMAIFYLRHPGSLPGLPRIGMILYGGAFLLAAAIGGTVLLGRRIRTAPAQRSTS